MSKKIQPVSIDGIEFDALITSSESLAADIPQYPVEDGYEVSDTMILKPLSLEITVFVSNTPLTHLERFGGAEKCRTRVDDVVAQLKQMRAGRKLVTITTNDATYRNMGLESMSIAKSLETGYARQIPMTFKEVIITSTQTVAVPASYGKSGATGASGGNASTSKGGGGSSSSTNGNNMTTLKAGAVGLFGADSYNSFMGG